MKAGTHTTEFWVNLGFTILCVLMTAFWPDKSDQWIPLLAAALSNLGYSVSRGIAKQHNGGG
jgi:hypothetical protein